MEILKKKLISGAFLLAVIALFLFPVVSGAEGPPSAKPEILFKISASKAAQEPAGKVLTIEQAVRIALDNQPRIRAAQERVKAQQAVVRQAKSAYYPSITLSNTYRSSLVSGTTSTSQEAFDFFSSASNVNWTIYNFGRREGIVREAKGTLDSRRFAESTSADDVILNVMRLYYRSLAVKALVRVREPGSVAGHRALARGRGFRCGGSQERQGVYRPYVRTYEYRGESGFPSY